MDPLTGGVTIVSLIAAFKQLRQGDRAVTMADFEKWVRSLDLNEVIDEMHRGNATQLNLIAGMFNDARAESANHANQIMDEMSEQFDRLMSLLQSQEPTNDFSKVPFFTATLDIWESGKASYHLHCMRCDAMEVNIAPPSGWRNAANSSFAYIKDGGWVKSTFALQPGTPNRLPVTFTVTAKSAATEQPVEQCVKLQTSAT